MRELVLWTTYASILVAPCDEVYVDAELPLLLTMLLRMNWDNFATATASPLRVLICLSDPACRVYLVREKQVNQTDFGISVTMADWV